MTPSDVSENMLPNCSDDDAGICLDNLICALEKAKDEQDAKKKAAEVKKSRKKLMVCLGLMILFKNIDLTQI